jgi:hypothetical protein
MAVVIRWNRSLFRAPGGRRSGPELFSTIPVRVLVWQSRIPWAGS